MKPLINILWKYDTLEELLLNEEKFYSFLKHLPLVWSKKKISKLDDIPQLLSYFHFCLSTYTPDHTGSSGGHYSPIHPEQDLHSSAQTRWECFKGMDFSLEN